MQTLIERMQHLSEKIPFDFVISYNQEARNEVLALQSDLEAEGLRGWMTSDIFIRHHKTSRYNRKGLRGRAVDVRVRSR